MKATVNIYIYFNTDVIDSNKIRTGGYTVTNSISTDSRYTKGTFQV